MWNSIKEHFKKQLAIWIVGILLSGFSVVGTGAVMWRDYSVEQAEMSRKMDLIMCKLEIEENEQCPWTTTITEDLEKIASEHDDDV